MCKAVTIYCQYSRYSQLFSLQLELLRVQRFPLHFLQCLFNYTNGKNLKIRQGVPVSSFFIEMRNSCLVSSKNLRRKILCEIDCIGDEFSGGFFWKYISIILYIAGWEKSCGLAPVYYITLMVAELSLFSPQMLHLWSWSLPDPNDSPLVY